MAATASSAPSVAPEGRRSRARSPSPWSTAACTTTPSPATNTRKAGDVEATNRRGHTLPASTARPPITAATASAASAGSPPAADVTKQATKSATIPTSTAREGVELRRVRVLVRREGRIHRRVPRRGGDDDRRRAHGRECHARCEPAEREPRRREHEQVGEDTGGSPDDAFASCAVASSGGAGSAPRAHYTDHHRCQEHGSGVEAHARGHHDRCTRHEEHQPRCRPFDATRDDCPQRVE
jgi:hypothetical protein